VFGVPLKSGLDLLLVLLYAGNQAEVVGVTRLVKLLFLLVKEGGFERFEGEYGFEAYNYGPWSSKLFDYLEAVDELGLIRVEEKPFENSVEVADDFVAREASEVPDLAQKMVKVFSLTDKGVRVGRVLSERLSESEKRSVERIKRVFNNMRLDRLLDYVYKKYPSYAARSRVKGELPPLTMFGTSPDLSKFVREEDDFRE